MSSRRRLKLVGVAGLIAMLLTGLTLIGFAGNSVTAEDFSTDCKWGFPWPRQVNYYLYNSSADPNMNPPQFSLDEVTRISYGSHSWSNANFNLYFQEWMWTKSAAYNQAPNGQSYFSWVHRGNPGADVPADTIARMLAWDIQGNPIQYSDPCHMDQGNPIVQFNIIFNQDIGFYEDCLAATWHCYQNDLYDFHAVAAHEFGHTFVMQHSAIRWSGTVCTGDHDCYTTMASAIFPSETHQRSLHSEDKEAAWLMYGCRNGGTNYDC